MEQKADREQVENSMSSQSDLINMLKQDFTKEYKQQLDQKDKTIKDIESQMETQRKELEKRNAETQVNKQKMSSYEKTIKENQDLIEKQEKKIKGMHIWILILSDMVN